jgi:hypothetical protein
MISQDAPELQATLRWIDKKVGRGGAIVVLIAAIIIAAVSFWAVNTYA